MTTDAYVEGKVLSADPVELVAFLYQAALDSVDGAGRHLTARNIPARAEAISKALSILNLLNASLDRRAGGDISHNLGRLYSYMEGRLLDANLRQAAEPLEEVSRLLSTLAEAWRGISAVKHANTPSEFPPEEHLQQGASTNPWEGLLTQDMAKIEPQQAWSF